MTQFYVYVGRSEQRIFILDCYIDYDSLQLAADYLVTNLIFDGWYIEYQVLHGMKLPEHSIMYMKI